MNKSPGRPVEKDCSITVPNMEVVACNNDEVKMNEETKDNNIQINDLEFVNKMNEKMYTKCLTNDKEKIFNVYSGEEKDEKEQSICQVYRNYSYNYSFFTLFHNNIFC